MRERMGVNVTQRNPRRIGLQVGISVIALVSDSWADSKMKGDAPQPEVRQQVAAEDLGFTWQVNKNKRKDPAQLIVAAVRPSSPAAEGKFRMEDVLLQLERAPVSSVEAFQARLFSFSEGSHLKVWVRRQAVSLTLWLRVPRRPETAPWPHLRPREVNFEAHNGRAMYRGHPLTGLIAYTHAVPPYEEEMAEGLLVKRIHHFPNGAKMVMEVADQGLRVTRRISYDPEGHVEAEMTYGDKVSSLPSGTGVELILDDQGRRMSRSELAGGMMVRSEGWHVLTGMPSYVTEYDHGQKMVTHTYDPVGALMGTLTYRGDRPFEGSEVTFYPNKQKASERVFHEGQCLQDHRWQLDGSPTPKPTPGIPAPPLQDQGMKPARSTPAPGGHGPPRGS